MSWYVSVNGQSYGPYTEPQMQAFVIEGRIVDSSIISADPAQGYFAASAYNHYQSWKKAISPEPQTHIQPIQHNTATATSPAQTATITPLRPNQHGLASTAFAGSGAAAAIDIVDTDIAIPQIPETHGASASEEAVFLIMAEIRSEGAMAFLRALQGFGQAQRIGDTVWFLRSQTHVDELRNTLSQHLDRQDRLFILNCFESETAWFNLGADLDKRIRKLWAGES